MMDPAAFAATDPPPELIAPVQVEQPAPKKVHKLVKQLDEGNLVSKLDGHPELSQSTVYEDLTEEFNDAEASMDKWLKKYKAALHLAKMQPTAGGQEIETKDFPFEGASVAMMPFVMEAMLDFASRASPDLVWS